jgi:hypothetical protein
MDARRPAEFNFGHVTVGDASLLDRLRIGFRLEINTSPVVFVLHDQFPEML